MIIKILPSALFFVLAFALALSVSAVQSHEQNQETVQTSSRKAYIDPVTGELTSTPSKVVLDEEQQVKSAQQQVKTPKPEPKIIEHPDGMVEVVLDGHMDSQLNATVSCDGDVSKEHGDSDDHVEVDCDNNKF